MKKEMVNVICIFVENDNYVVINNNIINYKLENR